jgi:hypothetical protein
MPKARTVDRFFWDDPEVATKLSRDERLLMIGCWTKLADDEGRFLADPAYVRKELFGYDEDLSTSEVSRIIRKISASFRTWKLYTHGAHQYVQIDRHVWRKHQEIRWVVRSKLPSIDEGSLTFQDSVSGTVKTEVTDNTTTSEESGIIQDDSGFFPRARALGSVGLGSVEKTSFVDLRPDEPFGLMPPNGNGNGKSHKRPSVDIDMLIAPFVESIYARHPAFRTATKSVIADKLKAILRKTPKSERDRLLLEIDTSHAEWCASDQWQRDGSQYVKGLEGWLSPSKRLWEIQAGPPLRKDIPTPSRPLAKDSYARP